MKQYYANSLSWIAVFINLSIIIMVSKFDLPLWMYSFGFIIACILDMFDGKIARKYNVTNEDKVMGELTDSLCDVINFGILPIVIYNIIYLMSSPVIIVIIISLLYVWASVFRLARFSSIKIEGGYLGLPITIAGTFIICVNIFIHNFWIISILYLVLSLLMVSTVKVKKLKI